LALSEQDSLDIAALSRPLFFSALVVIGFANGISEKAYAAIDENGLFAAVFGLFGVSILLWGGCIAALILLMREPAAGPLRGGDYAVGLFAALAFVAPIPSLGWLGLCLIAIYLRATAPEGPTRRAAAIVFALTLPLFWTRLMFAAFNDTILRIDATIIGLIVGTTPQGNVVPFADGSGAMFIAPACSSVTNLSLALLGAAIFVNLRSGRWTLAALGWAAASAAAVVAVNVTRISLIGFYPSHFDLLHGPIGAAVAECLALAAIVVIGYHKIGNDVPAAADTPLAKAGAEVGFRTASGMTYRMLGLAVAFAALLLASLAGKVAGLGVAKEVPPDEVTPAVAFIKGRGLELQPSDPMSSPFWIVGTRGECRARVTIVPPEGWARAIIAEQTAGDRLAYAFDGRIFDQQPVARTMIENYRRRLIRYLGYSEPSLEVRAIALSPNCPSDLLRPEDARLLSN